LIQECLLFEKIIDVEFPADTLADKKEEQFSEKDATKYLNVKPAHPPMADLKVRVSSHQYVSKYEV
jgi:hypothetical protein